MDKATGRIVLLEVADVLDAIDLPFFLAYGTALGAYRDGGFTPTEVDIDIGFLAEDFCPMAGALSIALERAEFVVYKLVDPFTRCWAIKATKAAIGVDLVANASVGDARFNPSTLGDFCHVWPASMMEQYEEVALFDRTFRTPWPTATYLRLTYGDEWRVPKNDCDHRCRVDGFMDSVKKDLLEQYDA